jgi:hypothetical protein
MKIIDLVDLLGWFALAAGLIAVICVVVVWYESFVVEDCKSVLYEQERKWPGE